MKVLVGCTGFKSNLFSSLELGTRMRAAGHDVVFAAPADAAPWIENCGFAQVVCPHPKTGVRTAYDAPFAGRFRSRRAWSERARKGVATAKGEGFAGILDSVRPDVVLLDCEHHAGIIQTVARNIPLGLLSFMYLTPPGPKKPPLGSGIVPGDGWKGSPFGVQAKWLQHKLLLKRMRLQSALTYWGANSASVHRALAQELGVKLGRITSTHGFQGPWGYRLPTLFLLAEELDFEAPLWPGQTFAGPMVLRERPPGGSLQPCDEFLTASAERKIFLSFGTVRKPPLSFIAKLADVARRQPTWKVLLATGENEHVAGLELPDNMAVVPWAPQVEMLESADCAIFHGGAGTLNECVVTRTPMIVYPNGLDGGGNGARVAYHGLGKQADFSDRVERIEADLSEVLYDASFGEAISRVADRLDRYEDVPDAFLKELARQA